MEGENNFYYVEKILDKRVNPLRYLVKWEGYDVDSCTWEPLDNLENVSELVEEFEKEWENKMLRKKRENSSAPYNRTNSDSDEKSEKKEIEAKNSKNNGLDEEINFRKIKKNKSKQSKKQEERMKSKLEEQEIPKHIKTAKIFDGILCCLVEFYERSDGIVPENSYVPTEILADTCPNLLIEFYESKIKFI